MSEAQYISPKRLANAEKYVGTIIGDLDVRRISGIDRSGNTTLECRCRCGVIIHASVSNLKSGRMKRCINCRNIKHGMARMDGRITEYAVWCSIKQRCLNPSSQQYRRYGGRGITICDRWKGSFGAFLADMGNRPTTLHSIDRIDNSKGYDPDNCRWATAIEQCRNRRSNVNITYHGNTKCLKDWAIAMQMSSPSLRSRIRKFGVELAFNIPKVAKATRVSHV
jgi:hypothetical protein